MEVLIAGSHLVCPEEGGGVPWALIAPRTGVLDPRGRSLLGTGPHGRR